MRSLGAPEEGQTRPVGAGTLIEKNRQFLAKPAGACYCFSERSASPTGAFRVRRATRALPLRTGNDSEMAPQAIEIAQNGLGNGDPQNRDC
jgi:hypothetical protein